MLLGGLDETRKRKLVIEFTPLVIYLIMNGINTFSYSDLNRVFYHRYIHKFVLKGKHLGFIERDGDIYRIREMDFDTLVISRSLDIEAENIFTKGGWTFAFNPCIAPATNKNEESGPNLKGFSPYVPKTLFPDRI